MAMDHRVSGDECLFLSAPPLDSKNKVTSPHAQQSTIVPSASSYQVLQAPSRPLLGLSKVVKPVSPFVDLSPSSQGIETPSRSQSRSPSPVLPLASIGMSSYSTSGLVPPPWILSHGIYCNGRNEEIALSKAKYSVKEFEAHIIEYSTPTAVVASFFKYTVHRTWLNLDRDFFFYCLL